MLPSKPKFHILYYIYLGYLHVIIHLMLMCSITLIDFFMLYDEYYQDKTTSIVLNL